MKRSKKINKLKVSIVIILVVLSLTITVFGRYIYNSIREAYFIAEQFYFTSDILTLNGANYQYNNWGGTDAYAIQFKLFSYESQFMKLDYDLEYTVTCSTSNSDKIECTVNSYGEGALPTAGGTIPAETNSATVTIYVTPKTKINEGETVKIQVTASTSVPYQKTLSCEFTLGRETPNGVSYAIEDAIGNEYAILKITNTNDEALASVTLSFDPRKLRVDLNNEIYVNRDKGENSTETTTINGNEYVNEFVFRMPAETTKYVKFYKVNKSENYTYPGVQATSPITVEI